MSEQHPFLQTRYIIDIKYPECPYEEGTILYYSGKSQFLNVNFYHPPFGKVTINDPHESPKIFKPVPWYKHRTIEELQSIKYVKVIKYVGYLRVGDVVPVTKVDIDLSKEQPISFTLLSDHIHPVDTVTPATREEHDIWLYKERK